MKFGDTPIDVAAGAILAHSIRTGNVSFKKGRPLSENDVASLRDAGIKSVIAARLEADDVSEDTAAARIAKAVTGVNLEISAAFTGRVNLYAETAGLVEFDPLQLDQINMVDESATVALLPPLAPVEPRQMVGTVKIIPFATPELVVASCEMLAQGGAAHEGLVQIASYHFHTVGLVQTSLPGTKETVLDKTTQVLRTRVEALGGQLKTERRCAHETAAIQAELEFLLAEGCEMVLIAGASAITDRRDVIPAAIVASGGTVDHFGMPVFADMAITGQDVMAMGAGGLLKEIPARPLPRAEAITTAVPSAPKIAAIILAAGQSRRMGAKNKLLSEIDDKPMVTHVAEIVTRSQATPVVAVLGHEADKVRCALSGFGLSFAENSNFADGLSTSLIAGLDALPKDVDGAIICLGDMPRVNTRVIDRLIAAFDPLEGRAICVPTSDGKHGNPILLARRFFGEMREITGDQGARHLIDGYHELTCEVEMTEDGVLIDVDTPQMLEALKA